MAMEFNLWNQRNLLKRNKSKNNAGKRRGVSPGTNYTTVLINNARQPRGDFTD